MADEWKETTIADFTPFAYGKGLPERQRNTNGKIPVYGSNGIIGFHDTSLTDGPTVIIGRKGTVGAVHYSPTPCWPIDTTFFITGSDSTLVRYRYYLLKAIGLEHMNADSAVPGLNRDAAHARRISVPSSENEQRSIASILGALDDKIELNRKMNETLEAMARAIFKSWFIDFDPIPGIGPHKEWQNSPLGKIPKGWRVSKVSDICTTQYGYTASASDEPIGPHFLRITDMNKEPWIDWQKVPYCAINNNDLLKYILQVGDVLVSRMADPGKAAIIEENVNAVFASYLVRLKTKDLSTAYYLFYFLRSEQYLEYACGAMSGSVQAGMNAKVITAANMALPPANIITNFFRVIQPLRHKITDNLAQSRTLAAIRDALLPKLLSGEIRVKDAEGFLEERGL